MVNTGRRRSVADAGGVEQRFVALDQRGVAFALGGLQALAPGHRVGVVDAGHRLLQTVPLRRCQRVQQAHVGGDPPRSSARSAWRAGAPGGFGFGRVSAAAGGAVLGFGRACRPLSPKRRHSARPRLD